MSVRKTGEQAKNTAGRIAAALPALERIDAIDVRLEEIKADERVVRRGYLPKAEVSARALAWLKSRRARFENPDAPGWSQYAWDFVRAMSSDEPSTVRGADHVAQPHDVFALLLWMLDPALEESLPAAIERLDYEPGLPNEERRRRSAELKLERERLVEEREGLIESARAAGMEIPHLAETERRRTQEAARIREAAEAEQRQAETRAAIDARHAGRQ